MCIPRPPRMPKWKLGVLANPGFYFEGSRSWTNSTCIFRGGAIAEHVKVSQIRWTSTVTPAWDKPKRYQCSFSWTPNSPFWQHLLISIFIIYLLITLPTHHSPFSWQGFPWVAHKLPSHSLGLVAQHTCLIQQESHDGNMGIVGDRM